MKYTLTAENADELNVGKSVEPGASSEDTPGFLKEGDQVDGLELPNGNILVLTGAVNGSVYGYEFTPEQSDETPDESEDATPVDDSYEHDGRRYAVRDGVTVDVTDER